MKLFLASAFLVCTTVGPALACMEAPEITHVREIALLDKGIETFKRDKAVIVRAKALRDRADGAFKAHQLSLAWKDRRQALFILGFKIGQPPAESRPSTASAPATISGSPGCTGGTTYWQAPAE